MEEERTFKPSDILEYCSKKWFDNPAGISALDLAEHLQITNEAAMRIFESFQNLGYGSLNRNVKLCTMSFDPRNIQESPEFKDQITHMFFPSQRILACYYEKLGLLRQNIPEYKKRLKLGAGQIAQAYFDEEVLRRYFGHPEKYETEDSESGGSVLSLGENTPYIWVRYSKRKLENGQIVVGAIYKDLAAMSEQNQKHWESYELKEAKFLDYEKDEAYQKFVHSQFYGEFADYIDPISGVFESLKKINESFGVDIFRNTENPLLKAPVENTMKSFCDSCSELDKLFANGNIDEKLIKKWILEKNVAEESDLYNPGKEHRPLSSVQMLKLVEQKICGSTQLSKLLKEVRDYRTMADHHIELAKEECVSYSQRFYDMCKTLLESLKNLNRNLMM